MAEHPHAANVSLTSCPECQREGELLMERGRKGFNREDVWGFNTYLAGVIAGGVRELAEAGNGYPMRLSGQGDSGLRRWQAILHEIADGFQHYADADPPERTPEFDRTFDLLHEWWDDLWD